MIASVTINTIICAGCTNYRSESITEIQEVFYFCIKDGGKKINKAKKKTKRASPRVEKVVMNMKCNDFIPIQ